MEIKLDEIFYFQNKQTNKTRFIEKYLELKIKYPKKGALPFSYVRAYQAIYPDIMQSS